MIQFALDDVNFPETRLSIGEWRGVQIRVGEVIYGPLKIGQGGSNFQKLVSGR